MDVARGLLSVPGSLLRHRAVFERDLHVTS